MDQKVNISFRANLNAYTGYGLHACQIISDFKKYGYIVKTNPMSVTEWPVPLPGYVRDSIVRRDTEDGWQLLLHSPMASPLPKRRTVWFTMWETSGLPAGSVARLNQAECVIVPNRWNAENFINAGVNVPTRIVPLGINTHTFRYSKMSMDGPCVFGAGGSTNWGGTRKGLHQMVDLFQRTFPTESNVRLHIKTLPNCNLPLSDDPRIQISRAFLSESEMASWFATLTCFVSISAGEAWGLFQQQALAMGRPIISVNYAGISEYFTDSMGYAVDYKLVPARGYYANCGLWAEPDLQSVAEKMRSVYVNRDEACERGLCGTSVSKFSWDNSNRKLLKTMQDFGMASHSARLKPFHSEEDCPKLSEEYQRK